jgi:flagellum-specific ATP synthase
MTVAEHFRDEGLQVLLLMDSVTRFALALREIGLAVGEPPATRGYPPSVFTELPRLLERAGPGPDNSPGAITALFTVLVEGDDHDEPVADAVRGILDGHVVLDRAIAEAGRYPPVDVLRSVSRSMPGVLQEDEWQLVSEAKRLLSTYGEIKDLVRLGAYRAGHDPEADAAVKLAPRIEAVLRQRKGERVATGEISARPASPVMPKADRSRRGGVSGGRGSLPIRIGVASGAARKHEEAVAARAAGGATGAAFGAAHSASAIGRLPTAYRPD